MQLSETFLKMKNWGEKQGRREVLGDKRSIVVVPIKNQFSIIID